jgi:hypothetical protein
MCDPLTGWQLDAQVEQMLYGTGGIDAIRAMLDPPTVTAVAACVASPPPPPHMIVWPMARGTKHALPLLSTLLQKDGSYTSPAYGSISLRAAAAAPPPVAVLTGGAPPAPTESMERALQRVLQNIEGSCSNLIVEARASPEMREQLRSVSTQLAQVMQNHERLVTTWTRHVQKLLPSKQNKVAEGFRVTVRQSPSARYALKNVGMLAPLVVQALNAYLQRQSSRQRLQDRTLAKEMRSHIDALLSFLYGPLQRWFTAFFYDYDVKDYNVAVVALIRVSETLGQQATLAVQAAERVLHLCGRNELWTREAPPTWLGTLQQLLVPQFHVLILFVLSVVLQVLFVDEQFLNSLRRVESGDLDVRQTALVGASALSVVAYGYLWLKHNTSGLTNVLLDRLMQHHSKNLTFFVEQQRSGMIEKASDWMVQALLGTTEGFEAFQYTLVIQGLLLLSTPFLATGVLNTLLYRMVKWLQLTGCQALFGPPVLNPADFTLVCSSYTDTDAGGGGALQMVCEVVKKEYLPRDQTSFDSLAECEAVCHPGMLTM